MSGWSGGLRCSIPHQFSLRCDVSYTATLPISESTYQVTLFILAISEQFKPVAPNEIVNAYTMFHYVDGDLTVRIDSCGQRGPNTQGVPQITPSGRPYMVPHTQKKPHTQRGQNDDFPRRNDTWYLVVANNTTKAGTFISLFHLSK
jgi:hypothetical protein